MAKEEATFDVVVTQTIRVTVDRSKFTEAFFSEFRESHFPFDRLDDHVEHLAQLYARGIAADFPDSFIEGYGPAVDMGIRFEHIAQEQEIEREIERPGGTGGGAAGV